MESGRVSAPEISPYHLQRLWLRRWQKLAYVPDHANPDAGGAYNHLSNLPSVKKRTAPASYKQRAKHPMAHPRMYDDSNPALKRLREICLGLPEVFEKEAWGECTFRVTGGSMFAMTDNNHHNSGHVAVWVKAPAMVQEILVRSDPKRFFIPPYMGKQGWVGVRIDNKVKWDELTAILKDGYLLSAPNKLRAGTPAGLDAIAASTGATAKRISRPTRRKRAPGRVRHET